MSGRRLLRRVGAYTMVVVVLSLAVRWLGHVDFDTHPSADVPSQPTASVLNEADLAVAEGTRWAETHRVDSHQTCQTGLGQGLKAMGCHRYVTTHKHIPPLPDWRTQPTTLDCRVGVYAHWEPQLQDLAEQGDHRAVLAWTHNGQDIDLRECNNIDNVRIVQAVHEPLARIEAMLAHVREGQPLSEDELVQLRHDHPVVDGFREHDLRTRYLALADELFALAGGRDQVLPQAQPDRP